MHIFVSCIVYIRDMIDLGDEANEINCMREICIQCNCMFCDGINCIFVLHSGDVCCMYDVRHVAL